MVSSQHVLGFSYFSHRASHISVKLSRDMSFPTMCYVRPTKDQSLCKSLEYFMNIKPLTEHHLEFVS